MKFIRVLVATAVVVFGSSMGAAVGHTQTLPLIGVWIYQGREDGLIW